MAKETCAHGLLGDERRTLQEIACKRLWKALLAALLLGAVISTGASADVGIPPWALQGAVLSHGESSTQVQMVSENVVIRIEEQTNEGIYDYGNERYAASALVGHVEAVFEMRNQGSADEAFDVWFPLWLSWYPWGAQVVPVQGFRAWVNDAPVDTLVVENMDSTGIDITGVRPWAVWPMQFQAGADVEIRVAYDTYPTGDLPYAHFDYILETGAGWAGSIDAGQVTFQLPCNADERMVVIAGGDAEMNATEVRFTFEDLEPTEDDNLCLTILSPAAVREIEAALAEVEAEPDSPQAYLRLACARMLGIATMKEQLLRTGVSEQMAQGARESYQAARTMDSGAVGVEDLVDNLMLLRYMDAYERQAPPEDLLQLLASALQRDPDQLDQAVAYLQFLHSYWELQFWTDAEGNAHEPLPPSEALLRLVTVVDSLSAEPIAYTADWAEMAAALSPLPASMPVEDAVESEPPEEAAEERSVFNFCSGSSAIFVFPIGLYWIGRKRRQGDAHSAH
ncbi:MAG: hypothetical protein JXA97_09850 [Anaerolineales bacterium]|nr:hypothetical protein [Anaerolineales bacterium]